MRMRTTNKIRSYIRPGLILFVIGIAILFGGLVYRILHPEIFPDRESFFPILMLGSAVLLSGVFVETYVWAKEISR